jgi:hypothetical protein
MLGLEEVVVVTFYFEDLQVRAAAAPDVVVGSGSVCS